MRTLGLLVLVVTPATAFAEEGAPEHDHAWHVGARMGVVVPLATSDYTESSGFGGDVGATAFRGPIDAQLDVAAFTREDDLRQEVLAYRVRMVGGVRHRFGAETNRAIIVRALAGVELGAFDETRTSDYAAESHRIGFAGLLGAESQSQLDWGGIVTLSVILGLSVQPFGDDDMGEANYVGLEIMPNFGVSF